MNPSRTPACGSDLVFDRRAAGELSAEEDALLTAHIAGCERCRARNADLEQEAARFDATPPEWLRAPPQRASRLRWLPAIGGTLALAAAVLLWARSRDELPTERLKGTSRIAYHVKHDGAVRPGTNGDRLMAGDAVQFSYSIGEARHLAVLSVDGARRVSTYFPATGENAVAMAVGREVSLPSSTVLDDTPGPETIFALFCDSSVALEPVRRALAERPDATPVVVGCTVERLGWEKIAR